MPDDVKRPPADGVAPAPLSDYFGSGKADAPTLRQDSRIAAPAPLREPEKGQLVKWLRMATASRDTAAVWENGTFKERPLHLIAADHIEALEFELAQAQTEKDKFHDQWFSEAKRAQSAEAEVEKLRSDLAQTQAEKEQLLSLPKTALVNLVDRFERHDRSLDADAAYVKWSDILTRLSSERLRAGITDGLLGRSGQNLATTDQTAALITPDRPTAEGPETEKHCETCRHWEYWERDLGNCAEGESNASGRAPLVHARDGMLTNKAYGCVAWEPK